MKSIKINLCEKDCYMFFNGAAKYEFDDLCDGKSILELIQPDTKEALDFLCKAVSILIEQGELTRRYMGYDGATYPTADEIKRMIRPFELPKLKINVANAVTLGYGREVSSDEEVDLVLQELEKKTAKR